MSLPPNSETSRQNHQGSPARIPSSLPSLSLPALGRVRGIMRNRGSRTGSSGTPSISDSHAESEPTAARHITSTFPDLVYDILQRARAAPGTPERVFEETSHVPHVQLEGGKIWEDFHSHATALEKNLQRFQDAVQELGSSLNLTRGARHVRERIDCISQIFQENARKLFPRAVIPQRQPRRGSGYGRMRLQSRRPGTNERFNADIRVEENPIYLELKMLAECVENLRHALEQFPEFRNADVSPLSDFERVLMDWSLSLGDYRGQFESREVRLYIHDLSRELGSRFEDISYCLKEFIDGVPNARLAQKHAMSNLQSLATIATFFSAVTATTLQNSYAKNDTGVDQAVNVFWFSSLVFSIASALNSFLVLTWRKANYSSPRLRIPWWLWVWIRQCPTVFLFVSVVTFLAGLGCFTVSSGQAHFTSIIVIISEAISAFGLAALSVWLAYDKWSSHRHSEHRLPTTDPSNFRKGFENVLPSPIMRSSSWHIPTDFEKQNFLTESTLSLFLTASNQSSALTPEQRTERARKRWIFAVRNVILVIRAIKVERGREFLESLHMDNTDPRLRRLVVSDQLTRQQLGGDTSDIQFDPQGRFLAVCGKSVSMRYELTSSQMDSIRVHLGQARQMVWTSSGEHLIIRTNQDIRVWSMTGQIAHQSMIIRTDLRYVLSVPNAGEARPLQLITIEGVRANRLVMIDVSGQEDMVQDFKDISIQHIDVVPDGTRVLMAAVISDEMKDTDPVKASPGRKLIVFNLRTRQIENQIPLWYDVQKVTISKNGRWAVVTYKDHPPPQLWNLRYTPTGITLILERQFCARERVSAYEYDPSKQIRFLGRGHFVNNDRYVLCAAADGKIHIWRRDRAHPVHVHGGATLDKDKPVQIACSTVRNAFMFATRSRNGMVRIWKVPSPPTIEVETPGQSGAERVNTVGLGRLGPREPITESPQDEQPSSSVIRSENQRGETE